MNTVLAVDEERGRLAGLAAVLLAVFTALLITRFEWAAGVEMIIAGVAAAAVLAPAVALEQREGPPPGWLSTILVAAFALTFTFLITLADVLGANTDDIQSGTIVWIGLLLTGTYAFLSLRRDSAACTLLASASAVITVVAAIDWIFSPETATTFRWVLLIEGLILFAAGVALYAPRGRHGVVIVVVSGLAVLAIAFTYLGLIGIAIGGQGGPDNISAWWEIVTIVFGFALAVFAAHTREPGPGYAAAALLLAFVLLTDVGVEEKFLGWPLVLLLLAGGAVAAFLRGGPTPRPGAVAADRADTTREVRL